MFRPLLTRGRLRDLRFSPGRRSLPVVSAFPGAIIIRRVRFWGLLAFFGFGAGLRAELQWLERRILLEPPAGAEDAAGEFEFINRGKTPVRVTDVRSGCGCTVVALDNDVILPGEKGRIRAVFHIGSRQGRQSVGVAVTAAEPEIRQYELTVEVVIKDFGTLTPRAISWKLGDEPSPRVLQLQLTPGFRFLGAESATPDFLVEVAVGADGAVHLRVAPRDTWAKRNGSVKVKIASGQQPPIDLVASVSVL